MGIFEEKEGILKKKVEECKVSVLLKEKRKNRGNGFNTIPIIMVLDFELF